MKKVSLKKLELKIEKISDLEVKRIKGGGKTRNRKCYTDHNPGPDTSVEACVC